jgi:hypothetical protein
MRNTDSNDQFVSNVFSAWFWRIIDQAQSNRNQLRDMLKTMSREDVIRFHHEFKDAAVQLTDSPFIDYMSDLSEDGIQDIAEWIVSQGRDYYSEIWTHPERIPNEIEHGTLSTFSGVADDVFWDRFREPIPADHA